MGLKGGRKRTGLKKKIRKLIFARIIENGNAKKKRKEKRGQEIKEKRKRKETEAPFGLSAYNI